MIQRLSFIFCIVCCAICVSAKTYTPSECQGSLRPYPTDVTIIAYPDSLTPILINHVGRHGSRYPAGPYSARTMNKALQKADSLGTITPLGREFHALIKRIIAESAGRWGALDSIGMAEHRAIAHRMKAAYPMLFDNGNIVAESSHSPRAIMSMYSFTHELSACSKDIEITTRSGKIFDNTLRPFDVNEDYKQYMKYKPYMTQYNRYLDSICPTPIVRLLGEKYPATTRELKELSVIEYYNLANLEAMGMTNDWEPYLTLDEYNTLWSCFNLRQYFMHCRQPGNSLPADIAKALLNNIIQTSWHSLMHKKETSSVTAYLRFAHQETVLPLMSLMRIDGAYVNNDDWDNLKDHFQDFNICPMAANVQFIFFKSASEKVYVRIDVNETPIELIKGKGLYVTWLEVAQHLESLIND